MSDAGVRLEGKGSPELQLFGSFADGLCALFDTISDLLGALGKGLANLRLAFVEGEGAIHHGLAAPADADRAVANRLAAFRNAASRSFAGAADTLAYANRSIFSIGKLESGIGGSFPVPGWRPRSPLSATFGTRDAIGLGPFIATEAAVFRDRQQC